MGAIEALNSDRFSVNLGADTQVALAGSAAVASLLEQAGVAVNRFAGVGELANAAEECEPSVVVLELEDVPRSAAELIGLLRTRFADIPVVLLCPPMQRWEVRASLQAGASAVVPCDQLASALCVCVAATLAGQVCVPRASWRQIDPPALSTREKQILGLVVMGYMNSQIAERLYLAESTVKSHLSSAFGKLGVRSRNEAVELILNPERGFGTGVLAIGGEPLGPLNETSGRVPSSA